MSLISTSFWIGRSLAQREEMTLELARRLEADSLHAAYPSVIPYDDQDRVPFYNGHELDNRKSDYYSDDAGRLLTSSLFEGLSLRAPFFHARIC